MIKLTRIILDLCAFTGAAWFLIINVVIKHILKFCNDDKNIVDVQKREYVNEQRQYQTIYFSQNV